MIRTLGSYSFSKFGTAFGPAWLSASESEFKFECPIAKPVVIPIEHITGLKPLVLIPWWSWGIQIDHNCSTVQSPILFGTGFERPSCLISKLTNLPFNTNIRIDLSTKRGLIPC